MAGCHTFGNSYFRMAQCCGPQAHQPVTSLRTCWKILCEKNLFPVTSASFLALTECMVYISVHIQWKMSNTFEKIPDIVPDPVPQFTDEEMVGGNVRVSVTSLESHHRKKQAVKATDLHLQTLGSLQSPPSFQNCLSQIPVCIRIRITWRACENPDCCTPPPEFLIQKVWSEPWYLHV